MNLKKIKDGVKYKVAYKDPITGKQLTEVFGGRTEKEARFAAEDFVDNLKKGTFKITKVSDSEYKHPSEYINAEMVKKYTDNFQKDFDSAFESFMKDLKENDPDYFEAFDELEWRIAFVNVWAPLDDEATKADRFNSPQAKALKKLAKAIRKSKFAFLLEDSEIVVDNNYNGYIDILFYRNHSERDGEFIDEEVAKRSTFSSWDELVDSFDKFLSKYNAWFDDMYEDGGAIYISSQN